MYLSILIEDKIKGGEKIYSEMGDDQSLNIVKQIARRRDCRRSSTSTVRSALSKNVLLLLL